MSEKRKRICIVPEYPASLMTGGLQVQAEETYLALVALGGGIEAELFDWSQRRPVADLYHFIGFPTYLHVITDLVRAAEKPYLLTILFGSTRDPVKAWLAKARRWTNSKVLRRGQRYDAIKASAGVITITEADAWAARVVYGIPERHLHIVPNGISESFFAASPAVWQEKFGKDPFVLCVGAVQRRKNQLLLLQACNELRLPVVLMGPVLPGEKDYGAEVAAGVKVNENYGGRWFKDLRNEDSLLVSAYGACRMFALLSSSETQPLSVMQAMAARRPVLLLRAPYVHDRLFRNLPSVPSTAQMQVVSALKQVWEEEPSSTIPSDYTWEEVAKRLQAIYTGILRR